MVRILVQSAIADFGEAKPVFDNVERVFDSAPDSGLPPVLEALDVGQFSIPAAFVLSKVSGVWGDFVDTFCLAGVSRIAPDLGFVSMEEIFDNGGVMNIGRRGHDTVDQPALTVDTDMGLHAKVPLVAFSGLVHIGVAGFVSVLGGARRLDDTGINDGAA